MRNFGRKYQGGWVQLIAAAISAAAAAKAAADQRRARMAAQEAAERARAEDIALQKEFRSDSIQTRVEDARKAGLHPLYALGASGTPYQPVGLTVFPDSGQSQNWNAMGQAIARMADSIAEMRSVQSRRSAGVDTGQDRYAGEFIETGNSMIFPNPDINPLAKREASLGQEILHSYQSEEKVPFGMVSNLAKNSSAYWNVPEFGKLILPDASQFSEAIEGLESTMMQAAYFYINRRTMGQKAAEAFTSLIESVFGKGAAMKLRQLGE